MPLPQFDKLSRPNLFRSNAWLSAWLSGWSHSFAEKSIEHFSCGKLPVYAYFEKVLGFISLKTFYPTGVSSKILPAIRNEYFQFPFDPLDNEQDWDNFWTALNTAGWDRIFFNDLLKSSSDYSLLMEQAKKRGFTVLVRGGENTFGIDTSTGLFDNYLKNLGKNTKLKLFNKRAKVKSAGALEVTNVFDDREKFVALLNGFHIERWGKPCFSSNNEKMMHCLLDNLIAEGATVDFSVMTINGEPSSAVFDIHWGNRVFNLQSGYKENLINGVSLGTLHLGYQIEAAFNNPAIDFYDLMAGRGKYANYKESLATVKAEFVCLVVIKSPWIIRAYQLKDMLRSVKRSLFKS